MATSDAPTTYMEAARAHGEATEAGDSDVANAAYYAIMRALKDLRSRSDRGQKVLETLLTSDDLHVQGWAATHLLPIEEGQAITALSELASGSGIAAFDAEMVLREWKAGRLEIP